MTIIDTDEEIISLTDDDWSLLIDDSSGNWILNQSQSNISTDTATLFSNKNKLDKISVFLPNGSIQSREVYDDNNPDTIATIRSHLDIQNLDW